MHSPASGKLPAGLPRLTDFEPRRADAEDVADMDRFFTQAGDGEILAEGAVRHLWHAQLAPPYGIVIRAIGQHRLVNAAVMLKVGLAVTLQVRHGGTHRALDGRLEKA